MKIRTKRGQATHDKRLAQIYKRKKDRGLPILVALPDQKQPLPINGEIPDWEVIKNKKIIEVGEVETPSSLSSNKKQIQKLKEGALKKGAKFKLSIAKEARKGN